MSPKIKISANFKKIKDAVLFLLTERPFWCLLFLAALLFFYAAYFFYAYALIVPSFFVPESKVEIKLGTYQQVMERLNQRETDLQQGIVKEYKDVFR
jgi:hypothetical protein